MSQRTLFMPVHKWEFHEMARYGKRFFDPGGRKITLNFALSTVSITEPDVLIRYFDPELFIIKLTPLNPTFKAAESKLHSLITSENSYYEIVDQLEEKGYEVILSIGEWEENQIGSNCGQYVQAYRNNFTFAHSKNSRE
jgi:23S rRNA (adenine2503-C2)-methyltransferase